MTGATTFLRRYGIRMEVDLAGQASYNGPNKTRQGYVRKDILKPAGYFFLGPEL